MNTIGLHFSLYNNPWERHEAISSPTIYCNIVSKWFWSVNGKVIKKAIRRFEKFKIFFSELGGKRFARSNIPNWVLPKSSAIGQGSVGGVLYEPQYKMMDFRTLLIFLFWCQGYEGTNASVNTDGGTTQRNKNWFLK